MELLERHFDTAFDAPDGIKKLRELILTLAMQGKLVPQDPKDQPASELLKEIEAEKQGLVKQGKIKEPKPLPPVSLEEIPYSLPNGWEWTRMGDFTEIVRGITFPANEKTKEPGPRKIACLRTTNVQKELEWDDLLFVDRRFMARTSQLIKLNDIVMSMANSRELVGKVAIVRSIPVEESTFGGFLGVIRTYRALPAYIHNVLNSQYARNSLIESASQTTNIANVSLGKLNMFLCPCPPLQEQSRIVAKVDELMARCDALEKLRAERDAKRLAVHTAALRQLLNVADGDGHIQAREFLGQHFGELYTVKENVTELRKAILQLAVMGKLVPQDPNDPPASELLKQIETEKKRLIKAGRVKESKPLAPVNLEEMPYSLPKGWEWVRLGIVGTTNIGLTYSPSDVSDSGIPVLRSNNIQNGMLDLSDIKRVAIEVKNSVLVQEGDLLVCARNGSRALVGKTAMIPALPERMAFGAFMAIFRSPINPFLLRFINSPLFRDMIADINTVTINQITQDNLRSTVFPLPPLAEQYRIVAKIDQLMSMCDTLEQQIDAARATQSALLNAMMAQYGGQQCA